MLYYCVGIYDNSVLQNNFRANKRTRANKTSFTDFCQITDRRILCNNSLKFSFCGEFAAQFVISRPVYKVCNIMRYIFEHIKPHNLLVGLRIVVNKYDFRIWAFGFYHRRNTASMIPATH